MLHAGGLLIYTLEFIVEHMFKVIQYESGMNTVHFGNVHKLAGPYAWPSGDS